MQEIFEDISDKTREEVEALFKIIPRMSNIHSAMRVIEVYRKTLTEREQEFFDFVFHVWKEEIDNESNSLD